jgi:tRNA nucleotidyltransferase (CCA-adding enzyme)
MLYAKFMHFPREILESSPQWPAVQKIQMILNSHGYKAYLAGGAVRDCLISKAPKDLDLVTEASVDEIEKMFSKVVLVGKSFGVLRVIIGDEEIEVAQFRKEADYKDGRHPSLVSAGTPEQDAERRDLTINALFYDLQTNKVIDYVNGLQDLSHKIIRCVGNPETRFQEDHLRLLRALRFKVDLDFQFDPATYASILRNKHLISDLSRERVQEELLKLLASHRNDQGLDEYFSTGFLHILFPERARNYRESMNEIKVILKKPLQSKLERVLAFLWKVENYDSILSELRLSKAEIRTLSEAAAALNDIENFFKLRPAEQWLKLKNDLLFNALSWFELLGLSSEVHLDKKISAKAQYLLKEFKSRGLSNQWPAPLIKGETVKTKVQGEELGLVLREAYLYQLESSAQAPEEVWAFLRKNFPEYNF